MAIAELDNERFSYVAEIALDRAEKIADADQILEEIVRADRRPTAAELGWFSSELHWNEMQVRAELRRMGNVLRLRSIAGTPSDRAAASQEAEVAAAVLAKEGPKISDQIDKLAGKLSGLERDARLSAKRVEDQQSAVTQLREHCPEHIREVVRERQNELDHSTGRALLDAKVRQNELDCCLDESRYPSKAAWLEQIQRSAREATKIITQGGYQKVELSDRWPSVRASMEAELAELNEQIPQLEAALAERTAAIQSGLDFYSQGSAG